MSTFTLEGGAPLRGTVRVPGDKSISHRALLLAALAEGTSTVRNLSTGDDVARTRTAIRCMRPPAGSTCNSPTPGWLRNTRATYGLERTESETPEAPAST